MRTKTKSADDFAFHLVYGGEDLETGSISAHDLAPALLAFADLVHYSGRLLSPEIPDVKLRVRAEFRKGSFDVGLELGEAYNQFIGLFSGHSIQAWSTLLSMLGISGVGLWQFMKKLKGRKPRRVTFERTEKVTVEIDGNERTQIPTEVWQLFNDLNIRQTIEKVVAPLNQNGIDKLELKKADKKVLEVSKDEVSYFDAPESNKEEQISVNPNALLKVVSPNFTEGNKWKVHDGTRQIWVGIEDEYFLSRVNSGEPFRKGDLLEVTLRTRQWTEGKDLKAAQDILKVHRHVNSVEEPTLPGIENA